MARKLTNFTFLIDTPFTDFKNTIYFESNEERDTFFDSHKYARMTYQAPFNFIRDRGTIRIPLSYWKMQGVNYCYFESEFERDYNDPTKAQRMYAFVVDYQYKNDGVVELNLVIDGIMTYCQGDVLNNIRGITVNREHLPEQDYTDYLYYLKNNNDVLSCNTKRYFSEDMIPFEDKIILIHSSVSLFGSFGDEDSPNIESPSGAEFDKLNSPVDLYIIDSSRFKEVMKRLEKFPWITQNFTKILIIPKFILSEDMPHVETETVNNPDVDLSDVKRLTSGTTEIDFDTDLDAINYTSDELYTLFGLRENEKHLLRSEYATCELMNFTGGLISIDFSKIHETLGLKFGAQLVAGYANELAVYPLAYNSVNSGSATFGHYLNNALSFKDFDSVPILIDNYSLALSKSANMRNYAESNLFTNRLKSIGSGETPMTDKFSHAINIGSNINPIQIGGRLSDQFDFYRQQKAEFADLALEPPTITGQTNDNSLMMKNGVYGIYLKMSKPDEKEYNELKKYYHLFGHEVKRSNSQLTDTRSQTICNYVQFEGTYTIPLVPDYIYEVIKLQFENGVRLWHNNDTANPFTQNVLLNDWR